MKIITRFINDKNGCIGFVNGPLGGDCPAVCMTGPHTVRAGLFDKLFWNTFKEDLNY